MTKRGKISTPNFENRPIGIGVSGLAEVFALMDIPYDSEAAKRLNKLIFACMYYNAVNMSVELARRDGEYKTFRTGKSKMFVEGEWKEMDGSPLSNGYFQFDMWKQEAEYYQSKGRLNEKIYNIEDNIPVDPICWGQAGSWSQLREDVMKFGVRNSMLVALMPTASSSQLLRNETRFERKDRLDEKDSSWYV